jgi:hypothetical protein
MARRETERDTYGGERRWSEGAGVSWAAHKAGPERTDTAPHDTKPVLWQGSEQPAASSGGILRQLSDELGITQPGAAGKALSDDEIREEVCERLWREPRVEASDVTVEVHGAIVTLAGNVANRQMKHEIEDVVASCKGVHDVDNRIRVIR